MLLLRNIFHAPHIENLPYRTKEYHRDKFLRITYFKYLRRSQ